MAVGSSLFPNFCGFGVWLEDTLKAITGSEPVIPISKVDVQKEQNEVMEQFLADLANTFDAKTPSSPCLQSLLKSPNVFSWQIMQGHKESTQDSRN